MRYIELGRTKKKISKMGLGTWAIGGGPAWNGDMDERICIDTIIKAVETGINIIDTAPGYNFGNSEIIVGKALKEVNREDVCLITKCGIVWDREGALFNKVGEKQLYKLLTPKSIRKEIEDSLLRLKTDYIDVYMTHWQAVAPYYTPISETVEELNKLKEEGKIKAIGAANVNKKHILDYVAAGELDIVQGKYSVLDREIEQNLIPICNDNKITLQAYSPLEQGLLSGTIKRDYIPTGARANKKWWQKDKLNNVIDMLDAWAPFCKKYDTTIPALALAWVMNQGNNITLLSGATTPEQVVMNAYAADIKLTDEDKELMRDMALALE
ncbi:MAG: NADH-dependent methylglyoxal reductase [Pleomorphochaeta sp.]